MIVSGREPTGCPQNRHNRHIRHARRPSCGAEYARYAGDRGVECIVLAGYAENTARRDGFFGPFRTIGKIVKIGRPFDWRNSVEITASASKQAVERREGLDFGFGPAKRRPTRLNGLNGLSATGQTTGHRVDDWIGHRLDFSEKAGILDADTERFNMIGNARFIELTQGRVTIVSAEDYEYLTQFRWCFAKCHGRDGYAMRSSVAAKSDPGCQDVAMHRVVARRKGLPASEGYDHEDRNKLNNQRYNIRSATALQNNGNRGVLCSNTTGYNGVCIDAEKNKYRPAVSVLNRNLWLKRFPLTEAGKIQAAYAHDVAAVRIFGADYAWLNPGVADLIDEPTKREIEIDTHDRVTRRLIRDRGEVSGNGSC